MSRKKKRELSPDERRLWSHFTQAIAPIRSGKMSAVFEDPILPTKPLKIKPKPFLPPYVPKPQEAPSLLLSPLDTKSRRRLKRGQNSLDATLDLHGMTQSRAHGKLNQFLHQAYASNARYVLVITGKGRSTNADSGQRGVLRQAVPQWLNDPQLSSIVGGFHEANISHGGSGALYVRLRRNPKFMQTR